MLPCVGKPHLQDDSTPLALVVRQELGKSNLLRRLDEPERTAASIEKAHPVS